MSATTYKFPKEDIILSPMEINGFLQRVEGDNRLVGKYLNELILTSYHERNSNFRLHIPHHLQPDFIGDFRILPIEPMQIQIYGNIGLNTFTSAENVNVELHGNAQDSFASYAKDCSFTIHGLLRPFAGYGAQDCTFKTDNNDTLLRLEHYAPKNNKIFFIHADGREEEFQRFGDKNGKL